MQRTSRVVDVSAKVEALRLRHEGFENELRTFENRLWLSPAEEMQIRKLKRMKLRAKDEIRRLLPD